MSDLTRYRIVTGTPVPPAARLLYSYLLDRANSRTGIVLLSVRQLAEEVGLPPSVVRRNLYRMQQHGFIRITARYSEKGFRLTNQITLL